MSVIAGDGWYRAVQNEHLSPWKFCRCRCGGLHLAVWIQERDSEKSNCGFCKGSKQFAPGQQVPGAGLNLRQILCGIGQILERFAECLERVFAQGKFSN